MYCSFCETEIKGNFNKETKLTCWKCVVKLMNLTGKQLEQLYLKLIGKGRPEKASLLASWLGKGNSVRQDKQTTKPQRNNPGKHTRGSVWNRNEER